MATKKKADKTVVRDLADLGKLAGEIKVQVIQLGSLPDLSNLGATIEEKIAAVEGIRAGVKSAIGFLRNVDKQMMTYADNRLARQIVEEETADGVLRAKKYLDQALSLPEKVYKRAAALAYTQAVLSGDFTTHEEAFRALRNLENRDLLVKADKGRIIISYIHYQPAEVFGTDPEDLREISEVVAQFSRDLKVLVAEQRSKEKQQALAAANITLADAANGKNGMCLMKVPAEKYTDGTGKEAWRAGGELLVRVTDDEMIPINGIGDIERLINNAVEMGVAIKMYQLGWDVPPGWSKESFGRVQSGVMRSMGFTPEEATEYIKKTQAVWWLIHRAIVAYRAAEGVEQARKDLQAKATITVAQFFGIDEANPQKGTAFLGFDGCFKSGGKEVHHLFFTAESTEGDKIKVIEVPEHVTELLGDYVGKEFPIDNCPGQLGSVITAIKGQTELAKELAG